MRCVYALVEGGKVVDTTSGDDHFLDPGNAALANGIKADRGHASAEWIATDGTVGIGYTYDAEAKTFTAPPTPPRE